MKINNNKRYVPYIITIGMTSVTAAVYYFLYRSSDGYFISMDMDKPVDNFISDIINGGLSGYNNIFAFCRYNIQNVIVFLVCKLTGNIYAGVNIYYMLTFTLIAVTSLWYLQKIGVSQRMSIYLAVLLPFLPYHIDRGEGQIITSSFFAAPLLAGILYEIYYEAKADKINKWYLAIMCAAPFVDLRLSIFAVILMILLTIHRHMANVTRVSAVYGLPMALISLIVGKLTGIFETSDLSKSIELAREEGMRILDLVMPFRYHILDRLFNYRYEYDVEFSANGESGLNSLGILLSIGFVIGMFLLFFGKKADKRIAWLSWINILIILIANTSGFNILFEYFHIHIVYWNRMAIYILLNSSAVLGLAMDKLIGRLDRKRFSVLTELALVLVLAAEFAELLLRQNMAIF